MHDIGENRDDVRDSLGHAPAGRTQVPSSLVPQPMAELLDLRTSPVPEDVGAVDDAATGCQVHPDLSPAVVREGWLER